MNASAAGMACSATAFHGGHPVACAVALEALKTCEERVIVGHVQEVSPVFLDGPHDLAGHTLVGDLRGVGLIAGVELVADKAARTRFEPSASVGARAGQPASARA